MQFYYGIKLIKEVKLCQEVTEQARMEKGQKQEEVKVHAKMTANPAKTEKTGKRETRKKGGKEMTMAEARDVAKAEMPEQFNSKKRRYNMPGFDGTGPLGDGPYTGRGLGNCRPGQAWTPRFGGRGRGFRGRGPGMGRFNRNLNRGFARFGAGYPIQAESREDEMAILRQEAENLRNHLGRIEARIAEIENS